MLNIKCNKTTFTFLQASLSLQFEERHWLIFHMHFHYIWRWKLYGCIRGAPDGATATARWRRQGWWQRGGVMWWRPRHSLQKIGLQSWRWIPYPSPSAAARAMAAHGTRWFTNSPIDWWIFFRYLPRIEHDWSEVIFQFIMKYVKYFQYKIFKEICLVGQKLTYVSFAKVVRVLLLSYNHEQW